LIVSTLAGSALASPAIVWKSAKDESSSVVHSSKSVKAVDLISDVVGNLDDSSLAAVFVLGRTEDGKEGLTALAGNGDLPGVASKYDEACKFHSHVSGVRNSQTMTRYAKKTGRTALEVGLGEFSRKLTSIEDTQPVETEMEVNENGLLSKIQKEEGDRARALSAADVFVVKVPAKTDPSEIDAAITKAIGHDSVKAVVVTAVLSVDEFKENYKEENRRRMKIQEEAGKFLTENSRRLEQQNGDDDAGAADQSDLAGVYYVMMTPNIFSGLWFALFFAVVTFIGLSCMGMITGQDVYVDKLPVIGREG